ncbi:MAG: 1,4-alpha-glucan branching protein GlgB [SAR324 cluster bacterium]|nr:1,4-alpha-glucan branching protein GlgB [SAR324 cluster bacterium]
MSHLKLSKTEKEQIVSTNHHAPRSVLGFHEIARSNKDKVWVIRVMEPDAVRVSLFWEKQQVEDAVSLKQIHAGGLFEIILEPLSALIPYRLVLDYAGGGQVIRHDPFYFSPQLTEFDTHLFSQGNHHQIYRKLGAHPVNLEGIAGTLFAVWAPNAKRVSVVGSFNQWDGRKHPMQSHVNVGIWELFIPDVAEGDMYKYEIKTHTNDILLKADPYGFSMEERPKTSSMVVNLEGFEWQDEQWIEQRASQNVLEQAINIYEVHLGSWRRSPQENDRFLSYRETVETLIPYVKEMGYTHIELLPISEHPLDASWGYQVTGYFAPSARYGSPQDFMYFVNRCHQEGIGVILDWVPGHFPKDEFGLANFDGTCLYEHMDDRLGEHKEWGTLTFNYGRHEIRNFLIANALFWFDFYHIDGIRVDAVASMLYLDYNRKEGEWLPNRYGGNEHIEAIDFLRQLNETLFQYYPGILSIAEESTAWPGVSHPTYTGGLGFNLKWNMGWMNDTLRYIALDPVYRKYDHHLCSFSLVYAFSENYVLPISHDEVVHGKRALLDKMPGDYWQKRANFRIYLAYQMAHPGKKLLFMGSEFGQWQEWRESKSLDWHLLESEDHQRLRGFCKNLNWFYRNHPALFTDDFKDSGFQWIDLHNSEQSILSFMRKDRSEQAEKPVIFIFNFTPVPRDHYLLGVPESGRYLKILDSDLPEFDGSGYNQQEEIWSDPVPWHGQPCQASINLPPLAVVALQWFSDK